MRTLPGLLALILSACTAPAPTPRTPLGDLPFATHVVSDTPAPRERIWDGIVEAVDQATLSAQTGGRVIELPFDVNDYVRAGEVVVRFTAVEQQSAQRQAAASLRAAEAAAAEAEAEHRRIAEVHARKLVAQAQLDQASARRDAARAQLEAARAALKAAAEQLEYTLVRAPYSGIVTARHVQVGETVRPGQPLISGLSLAQLRLQVQLPQSDVAALREDTQAALLLADGKRLPATRVVVFPYADPATHSFAVRVELPAAETGLYPGMITKVAFTLGSASRRLIPQAALVRRSEVVAVYVVGRHALSLRQLRLGDRYGEKIEVLSGLDSGERIALDPVAAGVFLAQHQEQRR